MEILKTTTHDGYRLEVLCVFDDCHWTGELDPQQPIWAIEIVLDDHMAKRHSVDWASRQATQYRGRRISNLELPLDLSALEFPDGN